MPEGHTIHRLAIRHRELFAGRPVTAASPQGRFAAGAALIDGRVLRDTEACGKHLLHHYEGDLTLHVHLGLYGKFADGELPVPAPVGQLRMVLTGSGHWLELRGPTACEVLDVGATDLLRSRLGADPLRDDADPAAAHARVRASTKPLAALLMDQSIVAGCGLIYANEVLFRAGLAPQTPGTAIDAVRWTAIWDDLRALMKEGVLRGRIDTVHTEHTPEAMRRAPRVDRHGGEVYVYRRPGQPCLVCGTPITRGPMAGRNLYWCPVCQPEPPVRRARRRSA
ncbi:zinc finger domain-containing protein [Actinoplanes sp. NEAU-A12]|uniref:DNA-(apurinic or apyrimidinic site) lyase n=1 Tax=Actinoplanes sandaracinus TaxID=3045177 RepID=A0ABT6WDP8_9ACTN|nr:DNA-formamidopyrimidine glycosylase family protein [Actinoplanes sandaracinus]MDI6097852.1 zinc finger domain-containing protein [Actinoplanes sandaracinus]